MAGKQSAVLTLDISTISWQIYIKVCVGGGGGGGAETERETENRTQAKTLFYKDCSLGLVKNLSNN